MNAKISGFVICVEVIIYLLLGNLHDCTFHALSENRNTHVIFLTASHN